MAKATLVQAVPIAILLAGVLAAPVAAAEDATWTENAKEAVARAAKENKDLLIHYTGSDWCGWCVRLKREIFNTKAFLAEAPKHFVFLRLDYPRSKPQSEEIKRQNREWQTKLPIRGYPTVFLTDANVRPYARTGYRRGGAEAYLKHLAELRQIRVQRDEFLAKAKTAEGTEKAKFLDQALSAIEPALVMSNYSDVVDQIIQLDPDNQAGLKSKYETKALINKASQALGRGQIDEGLKLVDQALKAVGGTGQAAQDMLFMKSVVLYRRKDKPGAKQALEAALRAAPDSPKAPRIKAILAQYFRDTK